MNLILASSSTYRKNLLNQAGYQPVIIKPNVDESIIKTKYLAAGPVIVAQKLARLKSEDVLAQHCFMSPFLIIGSDQVCIHQDQILDKPGNFDTNFIHLKRLQSDTHYLLTAVCLIYKKLQSNDLEYIEFYDRTELKMKSLTDNEIISYLKKDQPFDCAGGYKFESLGHTLIEDIKSEDLTAIQGLPMKKCLKIFKDLGF